MKKSKLAVGLMTAMLTVGALTSCETNKVKYSDDGSILTYVDSNGKTVEVKADDIFKDYYNDSSKYQSIFDAIYSIVVRNYFNFDESVMVKTKTGTVEKKLGKADMPQIKIDAQYKVDSDVRTAKNNADANNTRYSDELETILKGKGVETKEELFDYYVEEIQKEVFDSNFYDYHDNELKNGDPDVSKLGEDSGVFWNGYFKDMRPYHVSHILVKFANADSSYSNGKISEDEAKKLNDVVSALVAGDDTFGKIAEDFSEDTGSAAKKGDLGIMDYSTGYIDEFKLGVYAYENLYGDLVDNTSDLLSVKESLLDEYREQSSGAFLPQIPLDIFTELNRISEKEEDNKGEQVLDGAEDFLPRNIIFNKYLNKHSFVFITEDTEKALDDTEKESATSGFVMFPEISSGRSILAVKTNGEWSPVIAVRGGSDYQGMHFIVVNRSPYEESRNGISLDDYYTTYYPEQDAYPDVAGKTYVNFSGNSVSDTKSRADSFKSTLKSYNSDKLTKYIFTKYFKMQGIKLSDEKLQETLTKWINRSLEKKQEEQDEAWEKKWTDYVDTLRKQNSERKKIVSEACRVGFDSASLDITITSNDYEQMKNYLLEEGKNVTEWLGSKSSPKTYKELFKSKGGLCNDGKEHL